MFVSLLIALPNVVSLCGLNDKAAKVKWTQKIEQNESPFPSVNPSKML